MSALGEYLKILKKKRQKLKFTYHDLNHFEQWELSADKTLPKPELLDEYKFLRDKFNKIAIDIVVKRRNEGKTTIKKTSFEKKLIGTFLNTLTKSERELYETSQLTYGRVFDLALKAVAPYGLSSLNLMVDAEPELYYFLNVTRAQILHAKNRKIEREPRKRITQRSVSRSRGSF